MYQQSPPQTGLTLIELLIVITIGAILMGIGLPSYKYITTSYRIAGEINGLLGDIQYARAEAVREGQNVTLCVANSAGSDCATGTGATAWQSGWVIFSDPSSGKTTGSNPALVLRRQAAFTGGDTFDNGTNGFLIFGREGLVTGFAGATIPLHDPSANANWTRCLQITSVGAAAVVQHTTTGATCT